MLTTANPAISL